ncbi:MAG: CDP-alcohol phosphatidyltransferase family protein [Cypionkella sp.]|jgi:phosphatidylglycerophosphate synthase|nr:CDP-alcohol phosphatidyltransferase family protein [Cypionkella sp.]
MQAASTPALPRGFVASALLALALAVALPGLAPQGGMGAAAFGGAVLLAVLALIRAKLSGHFPHDRFGLCNTVTLARAGMTAALLALLWPTPGGWLVLVFAVVALSLDGVDGWLARRSGLSSAFGARFDMETDAALALVLAAHVWVGGMTGPEVLVLGLTRYVFVAAFWPCPWLAAPLPESFRRKTVCVIQIAALILLQIPDLPRGIALGIAWLAVAALLWSFGRDTLWLWRHRG